MAGRSGIKHLNRPFAEQLSIRIAASVEDFNPAAHFSKIQLTGIERFSQFALVAAEQAVQDARLVLKESEYQRSGVYMGSCLGGAGTLEDGYIEVFRHENPRIKPLSVLLSMNNAAASHLSIKYRLQGPNITYATACASSAIAIGEAYRQIKHGYADVMLAGGAEAMLTLGAMKAWEALRTVAHEDPNDPAASCKPFAKDRSGLVLGEGAAALVLESETRARRRGARIYAELSGYSNTADGQHIARPDAAGQARAMRAALRCAELRPEQIGYLNAHGTATKIGDAVESEAIAQVFGAAAQDLAISSTKAVHGHLMGAAGAVEFIACVLALTNRFAPPTAHLEEADEACPLNYLPQHGRELQAGHAVMSNSFAFGGGNAVLIAQPYR